MDPLAVKREGVHRGGAAELHCGRHNGVEYRLHIGRRAGYDPRISAVADCCSNASARRASSSRTLLLPLLRGILAPFSGSPRREERRYSVAPRGSSDEMRRHAVIRSRCCYAGKVRNPVGESTNTSWAQASSCHRNGAAQRDDPEPCRMRVAHTSGDSGFTRSPARPPRSPGRRSARATARPARRANSSSPARWPISVARTCIEVSDGSIAGGDGQVGKAHDREPSRHRDAAPSALEQRAGGEHVVAAEHRARRVPAQAVRPAPRPPSAGDDGTGSSATGTVADAALARALPESPARRFADRSSVPPMNAERAVALGRQVARGGVSGGMVGEAHQHVDRARASGPRSRPPGRPPAAGGCARRARALTPVSTRPSTRRPRNASTSAASSSSRYSVCPSSNW